ncbi:hypothetical protein [Streptomyces sp. ICBB 8177]|uniref:hypothetical protein n=1 Tax=Streptomyces sp. ICBB 8177 TaxID=563922 RepID=UPI000D677666|nr:hypothetical protein [Streptomyces sp. ICBB 8177]PWI44227.1 hypothetical protein CK485_19675 [Streptomyces sp. ICBB 8177]
MRWMRAVPAALGAGALCCAVAVGTATADSPGTPHPVLLVNGNYDARPGERVDVNVQGVDEAQGKAGVTATSHAFTGPAHLRWYHSAWVSGYDALVTLSPTAKPGSYPLTVSIGDRVVGRDRIEVSPRQAPRFTVAGVPGGQVVRPGQRISLRYDDLYPGQTGTDFTVSSRALAAPVRLRHDDTTDFYDPRAFSATAEVPAGTKDGSYAFTLTGPRGERAASGSLTVRAARPGDPDYLGKVSGPAFFAPSGDPGQATTNGFTVHAGGKVDVLWHDAAPDPGETGSLTATSAAFAAPVRLAPDDSKGADGDAPRFYGTAAVRADLAPGTYPVTVVSHHGRVRRSESLTVTRPLTPTKGVDAGVGGGWFGLAGGLLALGTAAVVTAARKRRPARA